MRVLHVDTGRAWRGGQTQLRLLCRGVPGLGVALPADAPLARALAADGVPVHAYRGALGLARLVRELDPDLVAAHTSRAHTLALVAARGRPLVVHRRVDFAVGTGVFGSLRRAKYRAPDRYVAVSDAVRRVLVAGGVPADRVTVVRDAVDPTPWLVPVDRDAARARLSVPPGMRWIAAVGALVAHKGHRYLVDAVAEVPDVFCTIAGEGELRDDLVARIAAAGVADRVRLLGGRDDVATWLGAADRFVHPSVEEGLGQAVIEAMLAGVPVIATTAGGIPEVVRADGLLVPPARVGALVAALRSPVPPPARERLLRDHAVDAMIAATLRAYARTIATA